MSAQELSGRPSKVGLAVKMFYFVVVLGVLRTAFTVVRHLEVRSPDFMIITKFISYALSLYLIYLVGKGKNWARWLLVIIFIGCIPVTILPFFELIPENLVSSILGLGQLVLYSTGLVLLFHQSSRQWFDGGKAD
ncbi:MAG: hypothetical protein GQ542_00770 [Desulforhopalus sp.]|jgi:hypothetical protein|nr:hypothetical protein [Desulforhopalus sp.]